MGDLRGPERWRNPAIFMLCLIMAWLPTAKGQNLVPNPGFEFHTHCPTNFFDLSCTPWKAYTSASPDYFHRCQQPDVVGIPQNFFGYQPSQGDGYAGFYSITIPSLYEYKEYLTTPIEPMQPGFEYRVLLKVSLADSSTKGTDDIGVLFYDQGAHYIPAFESFLPRRPQVEFSDYGPLTDKENWYYLESFFVPDSAYRYIVIGGFKGATTLPPIQQVDMPTGNLNGAYYYLDSVVIRLVHEGSLKILDTEYCAGDSFQFTFQVTGDFRPGNWFYLEMSDSAGAFDQPLILDSVQTRWDGVFGGRMPHGLPTGSHYRLRLRSTYPHNRFDPHPVPITYRGIPDFRLESNGPVCEGEALVLSSGLKEYPEELLWTGPRGQHKGPEWEIPEARTLDSGWYLLETLGCGFRDSVEVKISPRPQIKGETEGYIVCPGDSLHVRVEVHGPASRVHWQLGSRFWEGNPLRIPPESQDSSWFMVYAESEKGCRSDTLGFPVVRKEVKVTLFSIPMAQLGDTSFFQALVEPPEADFLWTGPLGFQSREISPILPGMSKEREGWYYLRASLGQCEVIDSLYILVSTAAEVRLYPNPSRDWARVEGRLTQSGDFSLALYDLRGSKVHEAPFSVKEYRFSFDLSLSRLGLAPGIYMLRLQVPEDPWTLRLVYFP